MSPPGTKQAVGAGGMLGGGKMKGLQVQGTAGIVKANPAFVIKTNGGANPIMQQSPLKSGGKGNIYPSYQLSQAAAEVFNGMVKPASSQGGGVVVNTSQGVLAGPSNGYTHLIPTSKGAHLITSNASNNVGISGLLNMTKQRGLYIQ